MRTCFIILITMASCLPVSAQTLQTAAVEVWQKELQYWQYVENRDTTGFKTLWHDNFIGYPETDNITRKNRVANWIIDVYNRKGLRYEFLLNKKVVNVFGDVVVTFYDETDIWRNDKGAIVVKEDLKITHTWKKFGDNWLIIGGMSAFKNK